MNTFKKLNFITMITIFTTTTVLAQSPDIKSEQDHRLQIAVATASKAWKDAFNAGDAQAATAMYEKDAVMYVKPFGTFTGKDEILSFWTNLIDQGYDDVVYTNTVTKIVNKNSASIAADWTMNNAQGIITNELWVLQSDGRALLREDHFEVHQ